MKKNTLNTLLVIAFIVVGTITAYKIVNNTRIERFILERNKVCSNLSVTLSDEEGIDECFCYYQGFKTGNPNVDDNSLPLCACECMVNGTKVTVGLVEPRA